MSSAGSCRSGLAIYSSLPPALDLINPAKSISNDGMMEAESGDLIIAGSVKNSSAGSLVADEDVSLTISGTVTKGAANIYSTGEIVFGGPSSASVTFGPSSFGLLVLGDAKKFTDTVAGMSSSPNAAIDLENIAFDDGPVSVSRRDGSPSPTRSRK